MNNHLVLDYLISLTEQGDTQSNRSACIEMLKDSFDFIVSRMIDKDCCLLLIGNQKNIISIYTHNRFSEFDQLVGGLINLPFIDKVELGTLADIILDIEEKNRAKLDLVKIRTSNKNIHWRNQSVKRRNQSVKKADIDIDKDEDRLFLYQYFSEVQPAGGYYLCMVTPDENDTLNSALLRQISEDINRHIEIIDKYYRYDMFLMKCLDAVEDGISVCNKDGYVVYVNNACCRLLDTSREEFLFEHAQNITINKPTLIKILEEKKSLIDFEYFLNVKAKNKTIHLINSGYPVLDNESGDVIGAINIFRSIKRSRKLANKIAGYQATYQFEDIIGESSEIKDKINLAKIYSRSEANVLIQGESGTGKELFAQSIHNYSSRNSEPFIPINCANFPNELIDSQLFGYEEGAFTGAMKGGKSGKFELANGGTLFLDEIGEMQIHLQAKLLRVVETKTLTRIGGNRPIKVDVRIIAATNRDLWESVKEGKFREDLYYRLNVLFLDIPSLNKREEDILVLAEYYIGKLNEKMQKNVKGMERDARDMMMQYNWPGNVRELENILSRALSICEGEYITKAHLIMAGLGGTLDKPCAEGKLSEINRKIIIDTLERTKGNKKKAADILGISRQTIYRVLKS